MPADLARVLVWIALGWIALPALAGCGRRQAPVPVRLPVDVYSDTARTIRFVPPGGPPSPAPTAQGTPRGWVGLDVRVDEEGAVSHAEWAGGSRDTALVTSAIECALAMRFFPALRAGRPVAVWCRQRFEFGR